MISESADAVIDVRQLRKTYASGLLRRTRVEALRGVSFQVRRGEIFGLLGPNGAGKTTLIKVLLGVVRRSGGSATMLGRPVGDRRGRRGVGYLPENHRIPRHHTGNSALMYYGSLSGLSMGEIRRRRPALLEAVGLANWGQTSVREYSKGMQQRLGLAQAMLHEPDLLILDEPTDGVDPVGRSEMRALLQRLQAQGKTIFLNSHLLQEVELVCDRVAILDQGELLREGDIETLTALPSTEVQLTLLGREENIRAALAGQSHDAIFASGVDEWQTTLRVPDQAALDRTVDALRAAGISLAAIERSRQTLEQAFMAIIKSARGTTAP